MQKFNPKSHEDYFSPFPKVCRCYPCVGKGLLFWGGWKKRVERRAHLLSHKCSKSNLTLSASEGQEHPPTDSFVGSRAPRTSREKCSKTGRVGRLRCLSKGDTSAQFPFLSSLLLQHPSSRALSHGQRIGLGLSRSAWCGQ